jgi:hypothetical protein
VNIVDARVGIFDDEFLARLHRQNLRLVQAALLIEHHGRLARAGGFARNPLQGNDHVGQFMIRSDDIKMRGGGGGVHRAAGGIVHERRVGHFRRRRAIEGDGANDVRRPHGGQTRKRTGKRTNENFFILFWLLNRKNQSQPSNPACGRQELCEKFHKRSS